jgi:PIN domain nuclease of toxin-antitoxin system
MIVAIADTHATIWYLFSDPRLGTAASAFTIAEMVYLIEKGRIPSGTLNDLRDATADPATVLRHVPFDENIATKMTEVPRQDVPDLPDRIIGATELFYGVPVLRRDNRIRARDHSDHLVIRPVLAFSRNRRGQNCCVASRLGRVTAKRRQ